MEESYLNGTLGLQGLTAFRILLPDRYTCTGSPEDHRSENEDRSLITVIATMHRFRALGPYYFYLDCIARFFQNRDIRLKTKLFISLLGVIALCGIAWQTAEWLTLRVGEYPGSLNYVSIKYQYIMRLLCVESLLVTGTLFAAAIAQQSGKIFTGDRA